MDQRVGIRAEDVVEFLWNMVEQRRHDIVPNVLSEGPGVSRYVVSHDIKEVVTQYQTIFLPRVFDFSKRRTGTFSMWPV